MSEQKREHSDAMASSGEVARRKPYARPCISSETVFETNAGCGKTPGLFQCERLGATKQS